MRSISAKVTADISVLKRKFEEGGQAVRRFGRDVKDTSKQASADLAAIDATAAKLSDQIASTSKAVDDLGKAFAKTGDATLLKQREQQQKMLADLRKAHALVFDVRRSEDDGSRAGRAYTRALKDAVSSAGDIFASTAVDLGRIIPPEVKIALVAGAVAATPIMAAAISGGLSAGAGGASIAGGIALAMRNPEIKAAAGRLGQEIADQLTSDADAFGPALLKSLGIVRAEFRSLDDEFQHIFDNSSGFLPELAQAASNALGDIVEGIDNVVANAGPSIDALSGGLELIGGEVKSFLGTVADNGDAGARALTDLFTVAQLAIQQVTLLVDLFAKIYDFTDKIGGFSWFGILSDLNGANNDLTKSSTAATSGTEGLMGAIRQQRAEAAAAATSTKTLDDAITGLFNTLLGLDRAQIAARDGQKALNKELREGAHSISLNTAEGRENRSALLDQAEKLERLRQARVAHGEALDVANAKYQRDIDGLIRTAVAAGFSDKAIRALLGRYRSVPDKVETVVTVDGTKQAKAKVTDVKEALQGLPDGSATVTVDTGGAEVKLAQLRANIVALGGTYIPPAKSRNKLRGGIDVAMAAGGTLEAGIYPASDPPLVKFAEPQTGGELYLPRRGDVTRGRRLVEEAAAWYGMSAVPMARGGLAMAAGGYVNVAPGSSASARPLRVDSADAALSARNAVAALNSALKENGRSFSLSSAKGRENRGVLIQGIRAAQDAARAKYDETGSVAAANKEYDQYIRRLRDVLGQQKASAATLRQLAQRPSYDTGTPAAPRNSSGNIAYVRSRMDLATAKDTARGFFDASWGKPDFHTNTSFGRDNLNALFDYLGTAEAAAQARFAQTGSAASATRLYNSSLTSLRSILRSSGLSDKEIDGLFASYGRITLGNRWGGVYEHMATGGLRTAHIAPAGPTRYAYAEPSTGGELFAPKNGDLAKTRAEVSWAVANWWGGQVAWQPGPGAAAGTTGGAMTIRVVVDSGELAGAFSVVVDDKLGSLADAIIYQTSA